MFFRCNNLNIKALLSPICCKRFYFEKNLNDLRGSIQASASVRPDYLCTPKHAHNLIYPSCENILKFLVLNSSGGFSLWKAILLHKQFVQYR